MEPSERTKAFNDYFDEWTKKNKEFLSLANFRSLPSLNTGIIFATSAAAWNAALEWAAKRIGESEQ